MRVIDLLPWRALRIVTVSALRAAQRERENRSKETDRVVVAQRWARRWKDDAVAWRADAIDAGRLIDQLRTLLTGVADALKGPPAPHCQHGWADLTERATKLSRELTEWKARAKRERRNQLRIFHRERPLYDRIMELERLLFATAAERDAARDIELHTANERDCLLLRAERAEALLLKVVEHEGCSMWRDERGLDDRGNAPGHGHAKQGTWDWDHGPDKAGKPCAWCATWREILALVKP